MESNKKNEVAKWSPTESDILTHQTVRSILESARSKAISSINFAMVEAYWEIGKHISEIIGERSTYGRSLLKYLSEKLTEEFGKGFSERGLRHMRQFYQLFPIRNTLCSELSWSHYRVLIRINEEKRRNFYKKEAVLSGWTVRQLERQVHSFFYERFLATSDDGKEIVKNEIFELEPNKDPKHYLKDPYVLEFLDLKENRHYQEKELEEALIDNLQDFLLELGRGFTFMARQKRITSESGDHYYVDLVFYNYLLKCFVVIDIKTTKMTYQDVGQIDFYTRLFDDTIKPKDDNPTIGILLVAEKDESIVKYSVLSDKENLFASKYSLYLPSEEELKRELIRSREDLERKRENGDFEKEIE